MNMVVWTFFGQAFMSLFKDIATAQGFGAVMSTFNSVFAGVLIAPQDISSFWLFMYYITPSHYVLEGLIVSQYYMDETPISPTNGSPFAQEVIGSTTCPVYSEDLESCYGTAWQWVYVSFGGMFKWEHIPWGFVYLLFLCVFSKVIGFYAIKKLNYLDK